MRCRQPVRKPETWTELVDSGADENEVLLSMVRAANELLEEYGVELTALRARIAELEGKKI